MSNKSAKWRLKSILNLDNFDALLKTLTINGSRQFKLATCIIGDILSTSSDGHQTVAKQIWKETSTKMYTPF